MKKCLTVSVLLCLSILVPSMSHCSKDMLDPTPLRKKSAIQLENVKGDGTLEVPIGTGNNGFLKISMDLKCLNDPVEKGMVEVPVRLFLTDFRFSPIDCKPVCFSTKVECNPTPMTPILPEKPASFESYHQFTDWLGKAYFDNENRITYDFHVNTDQITPELADQLHAISPSGYHFAGTYVIQNTKIMPDSCLPISGYHSERGTVNETTVALNGTLYLNKQSYTIGPYYQTFPHPLIEEVVVKKDRTKQFYRHNWFAHSEATVKKMYKEFPDPLLESWPDAPSQTYHIVKHKPDDLEEIRHLTCWDGNSGKEVDISNGTILLADCEAVSKKGLDQEFLETIVKDESGNFYTVHYQSIEAERKAKESAELEAKVEEQRQAKQIAAIELKARKEEERRAAEAESKGPAAFKQRFFKGKLIYTPFKNSDSKIEVPLVEGRLDISQCGNASQFIKISAGYPDPFKGNQPEISDDEVELWITRRDDVEKNIEGTACFFREIFPQRWPEIASVGIFWTKGISPSCDCDNIVDQPLEELENKNLRDLRKRLVAYRKINYDYLLYGDSNNPRMDGDFQLSFPN